MQAAETPRVGQASASRAIGMADVFEPQTAFAARQGSSRS